MNLAVLPLLLLAAVAAAPAADPVQATVVPGTASAETEVAQVLGRWDRARAQHDVRVLDEVMTKDFAATWVDGISLTRADILARRAPEAGARLIYREDIAIDVRGDAATATTRVIRIGTPAGDDQAQVSRETLELRRDAGSWRLVSSRSDPFSR